MYVVIMSLMLIVCLCIVTPWYINRDREEEEEKDDKYSLKDKHVSSTYNKYSSSGKSVDNNCSQDHDSVYCKHSGYQGFRQLEKLVFNRGFPLERQYAFQTYLMKNIPNGRKFATGRDINGMMCYFDNDEKIKQFARSGHETTDDNLAQLQSSFSQDAISYKQFSDLLFVKVVDRNYDIDQHCDHTSRHSDRYFKSRRRDFFLPFEVDERGIDVTSIDTINSVESGKKIIIFTHDDNSEWHYSNTTDTDDNHSKYVIKLYPIVVLHVINT